jgi:hypothetical protein
MTSSYGYQRPLSNEEELYLQNQALRAELQRREDAKQGVREAIGGGLATGLGLGAAAAGAFGLASAFSPAQRAKMGRNLSSTVDLSKQRENIKDLSAKGIEAVENIGQTVADVVRPSQPAPKTYGERVAQSQENARQIEAQKGRGSLVVDLEAIQNQPQVIAKATRDLEDAARTEVANQFLARGTEPRTVTGGMARPSVQPQDFVDEAIQEVSVKILNQPRQTFGGTATPAALLEPIAKSRKEAVYSAVAAKPESELPRVFKPSGGAEVELITDPNTGEIFRRGKSPESFKETYVKLQGTPGTFAEFSQRASALEKQASTIQSAAQGDFGPQSYLQSEGYVTADNLVDQHQARSLGRIDQFANAANAAEDQQTGRVKMALQRNEDENLAVIEMAEDAVDAEIAKAAQDNPAVASVSEVDAAINQVASSRPDGLPVDQAEGLGNIWALEEQLERQGKKAQAWLASEQRRAPVLNVEKQMYDLVGRAAEQGFDLEPSRALSLLTNPTIEMSAQEQRLFRMDPSTGKIALRGQTFEPGQQQTGASLGVLGDKLSSVSNVGEDPSSQIRMAASGTSIRGTSRIPNIPDQSTVRRSSTNQPVESDVFAYDFPMEEGGTLTWLPGKELTEIEFQSKEPTYTRYVRTPQSAQQRPTFLGPGFSGASAEELKVGLKPQYAPKGMRAVQTAEGKTYYTPIGDPGGVGIYGEERSFAAGPIVKFSDPERGTVQGEYTATAQRAPTEMPFKENVKGGVGFSEMSSDQLKSFISGAPEGSMRLAGQKELARREISKQSLAASELFRRGRIEGLF